MKNACPSRDSVAGAGCVFENGICVFCSCGDLSVPPIGSWAETARFMAGMYPDFDWDTWKDEMKERGDE